MTEADFWNVSFESNIYCQCCKPQTLLTADDIIDDYGGHFLIKCSGPAAEEYHLYYTKTTNQTCLVIQL